MLRALLFIIGFCVAVSLAIVLVRRAIGEMFRRPEEARSNENARQGSQERKESSQSSQSSNGSNRQKQGSSAEQTEGPSAKQPDAWSVLGIKPGASKAEITKAYREKMLKNHPDKVAMLDPALQEFANKRTLKIQAAYDELTGE